MSREAIQYERLKDGLVSYRLRARKQPHRRSCGVAVDGYRGD